MCVVLPIASKIHGLIKGMWHTYIHRSYVHTRAHTYIHTPVHDTC